jgi:hypothetical protein
MLRRAHHAGRIRQEEGFPGRRYGRQSFQPEHDRFPVFANRLRRCADGLTGHLRVNIPDAGTAMTGVAEGIPFYRRPVGPSVHERTGGGRRPGASLTACCTCGFLALDAAKNLRLSGCCGPLVRWSLRGKNRLTGDFLEFYAQSAANSRGALKPEPQMNLRGASPAVS